MREDIISKYNVPVPRYTSYPPANFFSFDFGEDDLFSAVRESNSQTPEHLSFYIHFPYCQQLCHYCGCNSYRRNKYSDDEAYIDAVLQEIEMVTDHLDPTRKISQIHFGGGSPTSTDPKLLELVIKRLREKFGSIEHPEIAIECHPGHLRHEDYEVLLEVGFNRLSIGIQDFDPKVLRAINRVEPLIPIGEVRALLKEYGVPVNLDFIYGLPFQSPDSFEHTIQKALELRPDRLVTFSYAHVPSMFPQQKILEKHGLPSQSDKDSMYHRAQALLLEHGYKQIGLDHFVLPTDELHAAAVGRSLHRNFQGYCTRRTTGQVYAFGVSAISQLSSAYVQNTKKIGDYISTIGTGHVPVLRGYRLSEEEQITREVINDLMCNECINWNDIADRIHRTPSDVIRATAYDEKRIAELVADGIITLHEYGFEMTETGSPLLRYVASTLDKLLIDSDKTFSKPI